jgi:hypothetical protein
MTAYQQGLLTLRKLRLGGHQRTSVQHIQVREGGQAIVGDVGEQLSAEQVYLTRLISERPLSLFRSIYGGIISFTQPME